MSLRLGTHRLKWIPIHFYVQAGQSRHPLPTKFRRQRNPKIHYRSRLWTGPLHTPFERQGRWRCLISLVKATRVHVRSLAKLLGCTGPRITTVNANGGLSRIRLQRHPSRQIFHSHPKAVSLRLCSSNPTGRNSDTRGIWQYRCNGGARKG